MPAPSILPPNTFAIDCPPYRIVGDKASLLNTDPLPADITPLLEDGLIVVQYDSKPLSPRAAAHCMAEWALSLVRYTTTQADNLVHNTKHGEVLLSLDAYNALARDARRWKAFNSDNVTIFPVTHTLTETIHGSGYIPLTKSVINVGFTTGNGKTYATKELVIDALLGD